MRRKPENDGNKPLVLLVGRLKKRARFDQKRLRELFFSLFAQCTQTRPRPGAALAQALGIGRKGRKRVERVHEQMGGDFADTELFPVRGLGAQLDAVGRRGDIAPARRKARKADDVGSGVAARGLKRKLRRKRLAREFRGKPLGPMCRPAPRDEFRDFFGGSKGHHRPPSAVPSRVRSFSCSIPPITSGVIDRIEDSFRSRQEM